MKTISKEVLGFFNTLSISLKYYIKNKSVILPTSRIYKGSNISIGKNVYIGHGVRINGNIELKDYAFIKSYTVLSGNISIGMHTGVNSKCEFISGNNSKIFIGNYDAIAPEVVIMTVDHDYRAISINETLNYRISKKTHENESDVYIGNDVWIGRRVIILKGVNIGDGAIIGAGAVVTRDVKPYEIVAGIPARHIKWRFPEDIRKKLLESRWWEIPLEDLVKANEFFSKKITENNIDEFLNLIDKIKKNES